MDARKSWPAVRAVARAPESPGDQAALRVRHVSNDETPAENRYHGVEDRCKQPYGRALPDCPAENGGPGWCKSTPHCSIRDIAPRIHESPRNQQSRPEPMLARTIIPSLPTRPPCTPPEPCARLPRIGTKQWREAAMNTRSVLMAGMLLGCDMAQAGEIKVMMSAAFKEAYVELVPQFERTSEHKVSTIQIPSVDMMTRLKGGETVDLVIMAGDAIDALMADGKIVRGSRTDLARSGVGVAVRAGAPKPDIGSAEALKAALLAANSVAYSTGPSGVYLVGLFRRMGIADALAPKVRQVKGEPVGAVVARGEADIGFQQVSELLPVAGITFVGPLPPEIQQITVFSAGLHTQARDPEAATALVKFLSSPAAAPVIRKTGMEPG